MLRSVGPTIKLFLLVAVLLTATRPGSGVAATVDPATVGTWELRVPNPQGMARWVWEIHADGTYTFHSEGPGAAPSHRGTFTASGGQWTLTSTTMPWSDGGTYQFPHPDIFAATGKLGTGMWLRSSGTGQAGTPGTDVTSLPTEQIGTQQIPQNLADFVSSGTVKAKHWRKDAVLVELRVRANDSSYTNFAVELNFYCPSDKTGLTVTSGVPAQYAVRERQGVSWNTLPIPPHFVDLSRALEAARQQGMRGVLRDATLMVEQPGDRPAVLAWSLMLVNGDRPYYVDGISGVYLPGDVSGNLARYDQEWNEAAQRFRQFVQSLVPRPSVPGVSEPGYSPETGGGGESAYDSYRRWLDQSDRDDEIRRLDREGEHDQADRCRQKTEGSTCY